MVAFYVIMDSNDGGGGGEKNEYLGKDATSRPMMPMLPIPNNSNARASRNNSSIHQYPTFFEQQNPSVANNVLQMQMYCQLLRNQEAERNASAMATMNIANNQHRHLISHTPSASFSNSSSGASTSFSGSMNVGTTTVNPFILQQNVPQPPTLNTFNTFNNPHQSYRSAFSSAGINQLRMSSAYPRLSFTGASGSMAEQISSMPPAPTSSSILLHSVGDVDSPSPSSNRTDPAWDEQYEALCQFKAQFGHCRVPARYKKNSRLG
ncbi:predicted protein [Thalassiosira pseudonana CCMP1335]|jgi:hypothetical protein|uniref:Helicase-associated domain-containing protein n=1 Tax=Thalassiosira pseudonana TaxID=35128 RepID=B5YLZ9_THAPS|nr:predicted protein [Thalassiosira pseudonana CCMP1335]ACI64322.1 predicted protein [Thalassiosira pseudonana CCMP1335]